jgi:hypothetical protein
MLAGTYGHLRNLVLELGNLLRTLVGSLSGLLGLGRVEADSGSAERGAGNGGAGDSRAEGRGDRAGEHFGYGGWVGGVGRRENEEQWKDQGGM